MIYLSKNIRIKAEVNMIGKDYYRIEKKDGEKWHTFGMAPHDGNVFDDIKEIRKMLQEAGEK